MTDHLPPLIIAGRYGRSPGVSKHQPATLWRVRWRRPGWPSWASRSYVQRASALRRAEKMINEGREVEVTTYALERLDTLRYRPPVPPPPRRRPPRPRRSAPLPPSRRRPRRHLRAVEETER